MPTDVEIAVRHGPFTFRVKDESLARAIMRLAALQELPTACPRCDAPLRFTYRVSGKHTFYGLECLAPDMRDRHLVDLSVYQDDPRELYYDWNKPWETRTEINARRNGVPR